MKTEETCAGQFVPRNLMVDLEQNPGMSLFILIMWHYPNEHHSLLGCGTSKIKCSLLCCKYSLFRVDICFF